MKVNDTRKTRERGMMSGRETKESQESVTVDKKRRITRQARRAIYFPLFFALIAAAIGCWLTYRGVVRTWTVIASSGWPAVNGRIIDAGMKTCGKSGKPDCHPIVKYEYEIDGRKYSGTVINPTKEGGYDEPEAKELLDQFGTGRIVQVYYDPKDPGSALLVHGRLVPSYPISIVVGVFFLVAAGVVAKSRDRER
jgi:hypothetical protein